MGSVGDCYDNALAESFFATLECELVARSRWRSHAEARMAVFDFIEAFYNSRRRHSSLAYLGPAASAASPAAVISCAAWRGDDSPFSICRLMGRQALIQNRLSENMGYDGTM